MLRVSNLPAWLILGVGCAAASCSHDVEPVGGVAPTVRCADPASRDQDDMAIWVDPADPSRSTVITADKSAGKLFVYDLAGKTLQTLDVEQPGNVDLRYGFPLGRHDVDIVAVNEQQLKRIFVYRVDPSSRQLERIDNGVIRTGDNYGGCLYHSAKSDRFYSISTSATDGVEQFELSDDGTGKIAARRVRQWQIGKCEGAVADDEHGRLYIAEEDRGVWELGAEPDDPTPGKLILKVGEQGLQADLEGLAIYHRPDGGGYLIVSNQGASDFRVFERTGDHRRLGVFTIHGARETDGIEVCNVRLDDKFPRGLFACHTDRSGRPVLLTPWEAVSAECDPRLEADNRWNPRAVSVRAIQDAQ